MSLQASPPANSPVRFRYSWTLPRFDMVPGDNFSAQYGEPHHVKVRVWRAQAELLPAEQGSVVLCEAESVWRPSDRMLVMLQGWAERRLPPGTTTSAPAPKSDRDEPGYELRVDADGRLAEGDGLPLRALPESYRSFFRDVVRELHDLASRTVRTLRWRRNGHGPHNPLVARSSRFSLDGRAWHALPSDDHVQGGSYTVYPVSPEVAQQVRDLVAGGDDEPLAHVLWREAWHQVGVNSRSALLVGVSALEVGVKECISTLVPSNRWLMENIPSPPIDRLLRDYLPHIQTANTIGGKVLPPPKSALDTIRNAVSRRNTAAHSGGKPLDWKTLTSDLETIKNVLWLLDYYAGHTWALGYIDNEFLDQLKAPMK